MTATLATPTLEERLDGLAHQLDAVATELREQRRRHEPIDELLTDVNGLAAPVLASVVSRLSEIEERGYLDFVRSSMGVVDRVMTSFTQDDVDALGDNVVTILQTVREMTQPEIMGFLQRTAQTVHEPEDYEGDAPSTFHLLREMRDPEVRRGLHRLLSMLRSMGESTDTDHES